MPDTPPVQPISRTVKRKTPIWVTATGSLKTRIKKAKYYLRHLAWVPASPNDGDTAMMIVVCNLRRYHRLCAATSINLVRKHYNPRCTAPDGHSWGWNDQDLLKKYGQAGRRGMYPTLGVSDPKALKLAAKMNLHRQVKAFWRKVIVPGGSCTPATLRTAFIRFRGGEDVTPNMLSRAIKLVIGATPVRPFGKKFYRGFQIAETHLGLIQDYKQTAPSRHAA